MSTMPDGAVMLVILNSLPAFLFGLFHTASGKKNDEII